MSYADTSIVRMGFNDIEVYEYPKTRFINYKLKDWRIASDEFIHGNRGEAWSQLITWATSSDAIIRTLIDRRLSVILSSMFTINSEDGEVHLTLTEYICESDSFKDVLEYIMLAVFEGFTCFQFDIEKMVAEKFPIELIDFKRRALKRMSMDTMPRYDIDSNDQLFLVKHSKFTQTMLGLFQPILYEQIKIFAARKNWSSYGENVATPARVIKYNASQASKKPIVNGMGEPVLDGNGIQLYQEVNIAKDQAEHIARNLSPSDIIVTGFSYSTESGQVMDDILIETTNKDSNVGSPKHAVFQDEIKACEDRIIKCVLGATLTMNDGNGSRALGNIHMDVIKEIQSADLAFVLSFLNGDFKKKIGLREDFYFVSNKSSDITIDDALKISGIIESSGRAFTQNFFNKIGLPGEYLERIVEVDKKDGDREKSGVIKKLSSIFSKEEEFVKVDVLKDYRHYKLPTAESIMACSESLDLVNKNDIFLRNFKDNLCNSKVIDFRMKKVNLSSSANVSNYNPELLLECLQNTDEAWENDGIVRYLKFYKDFVYEIQSVEDEIRKAGLLNNFKDVHKSRRGTLL